MAGGWLSILSFSYDLFTWPGWASSQYGGFKVVRHMQWLRLRDEGFQSPRLQVQSSEVPEYHFCHSLLVRPITKATPVSREGHLYFISQWEEWQRVYCRHQSSTVSILYVLLAVVTINLIRWQFYFRMFSKMSTVKYLET